MKYQRLLAAVALGYEYLYEKLRRCDIFRCTAKLYTQGQSSSEAPAKKRQRNTPQVFTIGGLLDIKSP